MKLLRTITEKDLFPDRVNDTEEPSFVREAARAIVSDSEGKIALMHVTNRNCYKLPGGGIDKGETKEEALKRECLEEIGCNVEIIGEVGEVQEYRGGEFKMKQMSYCYLTKLVGDKGENNLEADEIEDGFQVMWVNIEEAVDLIKKSEPDTYEYHFIVARDPALLEEAKKL